MTPTPEPVLETALDKARAALAKAREIEPDVHESIGVQLDYAMLLGIARVQAAVSQAESLAAIAQLLDSVVTRPTGDGQRRALRVAATNAFA